MEVLNFAAQQMVTLDYPLMAVPDSAAVVLRMAQPKRSSPRTG